MRPGAMVSSIASSSATRIGLLIGTIGPSSAILILSTRAARQAAETTGDGRQDARRVMVLGDADPVEAELLDEAHPLDHAAIGLGAGLRVVGAGGTGHSRGRSGGGT